MIIELRKKSQVTIPNQIVMAMNLQEGDHLDISVKDGAIIIEPVAVYSKAYIQTLERAIMTVHEIANSKVGPFKSIEEAIEYLEAPNQDNESKENDKK